MEWERTFRINLTSAFLMLPCGHPHYEGQKAGKIINVTTTLTPRPNLTPYMVAKAARPILASNSPGAQGFQHPGKCPPPGVMDTQMQAEIRQPEQGGGHRYV